MEVEDMEEDSGRAPQAPMNQQALLQQQMLIQQQLMQVFTAHLTVRLKFRSKTPNHNPMLTHR
jgi:hypothetical protein